MSIFFTITVKYREPSGILLSRQYYHVGMHVGGRIKLSIQSTLDLVTPSLSGRVSLNRVLFYTFTTRPCVVVLAEKFFASIYLYFCNVSLRGCVGGKILRSH